MVEAVDGQERKWRPSRWNHTRGRVHIFFQNTFFPIDNIILDDDVVVEQVSGVRSRRGRVIWNAAWKQGWREVRVPRQAHCADGQWLDYLLLLLLLLRVAATHFYSG